MVLMSLTLCKATICSAQDLIIVLSTIYLFTQSTPKAYVQQHRQSSLKHSSRLIGKFRSHGQFFLRTIESVASIHLIEHL